MLNLIRNLDILTHLDFNNLKPGIGSFDCVFATDSQINHITGDNNSLYTVNNHMAGTGNDSPDLGTSLMAVIVHPVSGIHSPLSPSAPSCHSPMSFRPALLQPPVAASRFLEFLSGTDALHIDNNALGTIFLEHAKQLVT